MRGAWGLAFQKEGPLVLQLVLWALREVGVVSDDEAVEAPQGEPGLGVQQLLLELCADGELARALARGADGGAETSDGVHEQDEEVGREAMPGEDAQRRACSRDGHVGEVLSNVAAELHIAVMWHVPQLQRFGQREDVDPPGEVTAQHGAVGRDPGSPEVEPDGAVVLEPCLSDAQQLQASAALHVAMAGGRDDELHSS
jgi:hypothetical protein